MCILSIGERSSEFKLGGRLAKQKGTGVACWTVMPWISASTKERRAASARQDQPEARAL